METRVAELTVSVENPFPPPKPAVMLVVPAPTLVAVIGPMPPPLPIVATAVLLDVQWQLAVMSCDEESENNPVAVKPFCAPMGIVIPVGVTEMEEMVALVTVKFTDVLADPSVAVMMVVPETARGCPLATPVPDPMVATVVSDEDQIT